ncbi:phage virion morphogenesis protein [Arsenophonus sp. PmNCSU2021_1]|uniref:phage virion morphogenesis protein n=1 Tax=Arsenophonus sp. PmNCSU2021_1 TaxID=3118989 RepID=UPI002FF03583
MSQTELTAVIDRQRLQTLFAELQRVGEDGKAITRIVAASLLSATEQAFERERAPDTGAAWAPLSDPYRRWRERHGYSPIKVLTREGDMARSVSIDWGDSWARIGANAPQAAIHQWGGKPGMRPGPAAIPARPFMGLDPTGERDILDALAQRLSNALHP